MVFIDGGKSRNKKAEIEFFYLRYFIVFYINVLGHARHNHGTYLVF